MFYLVLAIVIQCMLGVLLKISNIKGYNSTNVTIMNFFVAMTLSIISAATKGQLSIFSYLGEASISTLFIEKSLGNSCLIILIVGVISGIIFNVNLDFFKESIANNGAGLSSFFKQAGFIGGVLLAVVFFNETLSINKIIGIIFVLASLLLLAGDLKSLNVKAPRYLALMLINGTLIELDNKVFNDFALTEYKPLFLAIIFTIAFITNVLFKLKLRKKDNTLFHFSINEILIGLLLGVTNVTNNFFQLKALNVLDASIVFPTFAGGTLLLSTLIGIFVFKEKSNWKYALAIGIAVAGLIMINL